MPKMTNLLIRNSGMRTSRAISIFSNSHYQNKLSNTNSFKSLLQHTEVRKFSSEGGSSGTMHIAGHHLSNRLLAGLVPIWLLAPSGFATNFTEVLTICALMPHVMYGIQDVLEDYVPKINEDFVQASKYIWYVIGGLGFIGLLKNTAEGEKNNRDAIFVLFRGKE